jgi:hypothetical protein
MVAVDLWTKLTAIGTLLAVAVALFIAAALPPLQRYWQRPQLKLSTGKTEPYTRVAMSEDDMLQRAWLRVKVANNGRTEAKNVRVFAVAWYERPENSAPWDKLDFDPSELHWVSLPRGQPVAQVSLPVGLFDFVDLVDYTFRNKKQRLGVEDATPRGISFQPTTHQGEFVLTLIATAENAMPVTQHVYYTVSLDEFLVDVRLEHDGPQEYRSTGLLESIAGQPARPT